jgi:hypothetical protein
MALIKISDLSKYGVISDIPSFSTPANAWTTARNVLFKDNGVRKTYNVVVNYDALDEYVYVAYSKDSLIFYCTASAIYSTSGGESTLLVPPEITIAASNEWHIEELSNVLIFSSPNNVPYYFDKGTNLIAELQGWNADWRTNKIVAYKNFLVALGTTENGISLPQRVRWSDLAIPGDIPNDWDATSTTNSAGFNDLSECKGDIIDALPLGDSLIIYTDLEVYEMRYTGGNNIFSFRKLSDNVGILCRGAVDVVKNAHILVTSGDVVSFTTGGYQSLVQDKIKKYLYEQFNKAKNNRTRVRYDLQHNNVWVAYSTTSDQSYMNEVAILDLASGAWSFKTIPPLSCITKGVLPSSSLRIIDDQAIIIDHDSALIDGELGDFTESSIYGVINNGGVFNWAILAASSSENSTLSSLEKLYIDMDEFGLPNTVNKQLRIIRPQIKGRGEMFFSVGTSNEPDSAITWSPAKKFDPSTDYQLDFRIDGRYLSLRVEASTDKDWSLQSITLDVIERGLR